MTCPEVLPTEYITAYIDYSLSATIETVFLSHHGYGDRGARTISVQ